jgi:hypothetical protein
VGLVLDGARFFCAWAWFERLKQKKPSASAISTLLVRPFLGLVEVRFICLVSTRKLANKSVVQPVKTIIFASPE